MVGINYPWLNYGWDFGDPPVGWTGGRTTANFRASTRDRIAADLREIAALGMEVVRWFVLADGLAYGTGAVAPKEDGRFFVLPPGDPWTRQMVADFAFVLDLCAEAGVKLLPSLVDFHWCFAPDVLDGGSVVKGGRAAVLRDADQRRIFFDTVLEPLLEASKARRESIYAWEVMNEPEWCTGHSKWKFWQKQATKNKNMPREDMRAFLKEGVRRVNAAGFVSTIGWAEWHTIRDWGTEDWGIGLQQFHYYPKDNGALPRALDVTSQPCLLGEFASDPAKLWPGAAQALNARLQHIRDLGYAGALIWSMAAKDEYTLWNADQRRLITLYSGVPAPREPGGITTA